MAKTKLMKLTPDMKTFTANGVKYTIEDSISEKRWAIYLRLQAQLGFNLHFGEMFEELRSAYQYLNKNEIANAAVKIYNLMEGVKHVGEAETPTIIAMCALFINTDDEDRRTITDEMIEKKRHDWNEEGIDMNSFFQLAIHSIPGLIDAYKELSLNTLKQ